VETRSVDKNDLSFATVIHATNPRARRLRLIGDDGDLDSTNCVHQC